MPLLEKMAKQYGLLLISKERFGNYFNKKRKCGNKEVELLRRMFALEAYPSDHLLADESQYQFAKVWDCSVEDWRSGMYV